jgi:hypothetical protein
VANHKRKKPKNARAGCLHCKPHKANGAKDKEPVAVKKLEETRKLVREVAADEVECD